MAENLGVILKLRSFEEINKDDDAASLSACFVSMLSQQEKDALADYAVRLLVLDWRRERELAIEREFAPIVKPRWEIEYERIASEQKRKSVMEERFVQIFSDPLKAYLRGTPFANISERRAFKTWCADRFEQWYATTQCAMYEVCKDEIDDIESRYHTFQSDFFKGGIEAYYRIRQFEAINREVSEHIMRVAMRVRLETTEELLKSMFALGDGRKVTWGEATVEEHQQRICLLMKNITANTETAARHQAAINMLTEAGANCLAEIVRVACV